MFKYSKEGISKLCSFRKINTFDLEMQRREIFLPAQENKSSGLFSKIKYYIKNWWYKESISLTDSYYLRQEAILLNQHIQNLQDSDSDLETIPLL